jgi:hypothetical protein
MMTDLQKARADWLDAETRVLELQQRVVTLQMENLKLLEMLIAAQVRAAFTPPFIWSLK